MVVVCGSPFTVGSWWLGVCGLQLGGGEGTGTFHMRELSLMGLRRPMGLMGGSQQPLTGEP